MRQISASFSRRECSVESVSARKDLVVLVADRNIEAAIQGVLARPEAVGIREVSSRILVHPERDSGCFSRGAEFLRPLSDEHEHGLIVLDRDGCGRNTENRDTLERELEGRLGASGWENRARALVIQPELEVWVWGPSPHVDEVLGWKGRSPDLRNWLVSRGFLSKGAATPPNPKEAMEEALRQVSTPRSSILYSRLAARVSFAKCSDPAFVKLKATLSEWFPAEPHAVSAGL